MELSEVYGPEYHMGTRLAHRGKPAMRMYSAVVNVFKNISSIIELGCSAGVLLEPFHEAGIEALGVDGDPTSFLDGIRCVPMELLRVHDLRIPFYPSKKFDVCLCTETLEHIEPEFADIAIDSICRCSDNLFMTIAVPGQGGIGHVNLRPIEEWEEDFKKRGFGKRRGRLAGDLSTWTTLLIMTRRTK